MLRRTGRTLSQWQQWLISSEAWQSGAATLCEHFLAEVMEAIGTREEKSDAAWLKRDAVIDIECIYEAVSDDEELFSFWQFVGMKAHYPPEAYIPASPSYQQQLKQRIHDAVAISAPWLTDQATVERHVADWQDGRLASGDALFFQRFHIRPIAHLGTRLDFKRGESGDGTYDDVAVRCSTAATFDMLDAAGVSWPCIVHCKVFHAIGRLQQPRVWITVRHRPDNRLLVDTAPLDAQDVEDWDTRWVRLRLRVIDPYSVLMPADDDDATTPQYCCHGHMRGMSAEEWHRATGSLRVYYYSQSFAEQERADEGAPLTSRDDSSPTKRLRTEGELGRAPFPTSLADVKDWPLYRVRQRVEIRRMAAIAARLALLDAVVDLAAFRAHQPDHVRQAFVDAASHRRAALAATLVSPAPNPDTRTSTDQPPVPLEVDIPLPPSFSLVQSPLPAAAPAAASYAAALDSVRHLSDSAELGMQMALYDELYGGSERQLDPLVFDNVTTTRLDEPCDSSQPWNNKLPERHEVAAGAAG